MQKISSWKLLKQKISSIHRPLLALVKIVLVSHLNIIFVKIMRLKEFTGLFLRLFLKVYLIKHFGINLWNKMILNHFLINMIRMDIRPRVRDILMLEANVMAEIFRNLDVLVDHGAFMRVKYSMGIQLVLVGTLVLVRTTN